MFEAFNYFSRSSTRFLRSYSLTSSPFSSRSNYLGTACKNDFLSSASILLLFSIKSFISYNIFFTSSRVFFSNNFTTTSYNFYSLSSDDFLIMTPVSYFKYFFNSSIVKALLKFYHS